MSSGEVRRLLPLPHRYSTNKPFIFSILVLYPSGFEVVNMVISTVFFRPSRGNWTAVGRRAPG